MSTSPQKRKKAAEVDLHTIPASEKKQKKGGLFRSLRGPKELGLLFLAPPAITLEETLELLRFAASLDGRTEHRRIAVVPASLEEVFQSSGVFTVVHSYSADEEFGAAVKGASARIDLRFATRDPGLRGLSVHTLRSHISHYHRNPSFWAALSEGVLDKLPIAKKIRKRSLEKDLETAELHIAPHTLRFRALLRRIFEASTPRSIPVWLPVSLDPFTGSPWPFSNYMRLSRILSQNNIPFLVSFDEDGARRRSRKDQEVLSGLPAFRKELSLLSRKYGGVQILESPSTSDLFSLAKGATLAVGSPSAELLLSQAHGGRVLFLHDMLTFRSAHAMQAEQVPAHPSHGRALFSDAVEMGGGTGLHPHVDDCARDCPACDNNFCVDTISPEKVWEELRSLLNQVGEVGQSSP